MIINISLFYWSVSAYFHKHLIIKCQYLRPESIEITYQRTNLAKSLKEVDTNAESKDIERKVKTKNNRHQPVGIRQAPTESKKLEIIRQCRPDWNPIIANKIQLQLHNITKDDQVARQHFPQGNLQIEVEKGLYGHGLSRLSLLLEGQIAEEAPVE